VGFIYVSPFREVKNILPDGCLSTVLRVLRFYCFGVFATHYKCHVCAKIKINQTVNDGVAYSKNPRKCAYHVTFDLDLDMEHTVDAR